MAATAPAGGLTASVMSRGQARRRVGKMLVHAGRYMQALPHLCDALALFQQVTLVHAAMHPLSWLLLCTWQRAGSSVTEMPSSPRMHARITM